MWVSEENTRMIFAKYSWKQPDFILKHCCSEQCSWRSVYATVYSFPLVPSTSFSKQPHITMCIPSPHSLTVEGEVVRVYTRSKISIYSPEKAFQGSASHELKEQNSDPWSTKLKPEVLESGSFLPWKLVSQLCLALLSTYTIKLNRRTSIKTNYYEIKHSQWTRVFFCKVW